MRGREIDNGIQFVGRDLVEVAQARVRLAHQEPGQSQVAASERVGEARFDRDQPELDQPVRAEAGKDRVAPLRGLECPARRGGAGRAPQRKSARHSPPGGRRTVKSRHRRATGDCRKHHQVAPGADLRQAQCRQPDASRGAGAPAQPFRQSQRQSMRAGRLGQPDTHDLGTGDRDPASVDGADTTARCRIAVRSPSFRSRSRSFARRRTCSRLRRGGRAGMGTSPLVLGCRGERQARRRHAPACVEHRWLRRGLAVAVGRPSRQP